MRGSKSIFALVILVLAFSAVSAAAQDYAKPVNKTGSVALVIPPAGTVRYNTITYYFTTELAISVRFETLDPIRIKLSVKALVMQPTACMVQWEAYPPVELDLGPDGTGSFILNTETGYAEK